MSIAMLVLVLIPCAIMFNIEMDYSIDKVGLDFFEISFRTGYKIYLDYNNFLGFWVPYLNIYFRMSNETFIDMNIKFWPPSLEYNSNSSININNPLSSNSIIQNPKNDNLDIIKSNIHLSSENSERYLEEKEIIMKGMDHAFGIWSTTIVLLSLALIIPPEYLHIRWYIQIAAFIFNLIGIFTALTTYFQMFFGGDFIYDPYELFLYLIGTGIVSIWSGILFYKNGKSKNAENFNDFSN